MLNIAMVQTGNYLGRGKEYVAKLVDGIRCNLYESIDYRGLTDFRFVCFTDDPGALPNGVEARELPSGLTGWWAKLAMFRAEAFKPGERVLFFDLDTIILGSLADIVSYDGKFVVLRDMFFPDHAGSACMAWEAGAIDHIWTRWDEAGRPSFDPRGDQFWIETMQPEADRWQDIAPKQFVSFKVDCWLQGKIPDGARVLLFHGHPRPHECRATFVENLWKRPLVQAA